MLAVPWRVFLAAFIEQFRIKRRRWPDPLALNRFFPARDALLRDQLGAQADDVLAGLSRTPVPAFGPQSNLGGGHQMRRVGARYPDSGPVSESAPSSDPPTART